jgi:hypothetical protein
MRDRRASGDRGPFDIRYEAQEMSVVVDTVLTEDCEGQLDYLRELLRLPQFKVYTELQPGETPCASRFRIDLPEQQDGRTGIDSDNAAALIEDPAGPRSLHLIAAARNNMEAARRRALSRGLEPEDAAVAASSPVPPPRSARIF